MTHIRSEDLGNASMVKVTREIPLPWLLGGVAAFIFNTAQSWQSTGNLEKLGEAQNKTLEKLSEKIEKTNALVVTDGGIRAQKDNEHDLLLKTLENRVTALESLYPRAILQQQQQQLGSPNRPQPPRQ